MAGDSSESAGIATGTGARVVVTGAGGFIGRALVAHYAAEGREHLALVRRSAHAAGAKLRCVPDLATVRDDELDTIVDGAEAIVHLAGRAHAPGTLAAEPAGDYASANVVATAKLARAAARCGVRRFVLASSVKVNGEASVASQPFRPGDPPAPADEYARSKLEAERELLAALARTRTMPIVLRLPLVYGPGVKGHFAALVDEVARGRSLPIGAIDNRRSLLYVRNLVEAIDAALDADEAPVGVHFVADAFPVSVPDLARAIGWVLGVRVRLPAVPVPVLSLGGRLAGRRALVERLVSSLEVDTTSFCRATGWLPAYTLHEGLEATAWAWRMRHAL